MSGKRISGIAWNERKVMIRAPVSLSAARMGAGVPTEVVGEIRSVEGMYRLFYLLCCRSDIS